MIILKMKKEEEKTKRRKNEGLVREGKSLSYSVIR
jgi:hypothetical protein